MANFFGKPIAQIDADDILSLKDTPEGQLFEIKSELPAEKKSKDHWYTTPEPGETRRGPGDYAKHNIFKEIVAFANSEGGWLVIGLTETSDHPKRVKGVAPLPDCHALADRFKRAAYDWIDPPLPSLQCCGIEIGDTPGEGIIVFRVPRSLDAPHRLNKKDREAYKRVGDESKPMKMREIQGLTLDMARGQVRIDREFDNARKRYLLLKPKRSPKRRLVGFYVALVPSTGPVVVDRPYLQTSLFEREDKIEGIFQNGGKFAIETIDNALNRSVSTVQPILRGGRKTWSGTYESRDRQSVEEDFITIEIFDSGTIQLSVKSTFDDPPGLSLRWILADLANALCITERTRTIAGMPDVEYAMEVELRFDEISAFGKSELSKQEFGFGLLNEEDFHFSRKLGPGFLLLPRYRVGIIDNFPSVVKLIMDDLYNAVGKPHIEDFGFDRIC